MQVVIPLGFATSACFGRSPEPFAPLAVPNCVVSTVEIPSAEDEGEFVRIVRSGTLGEAGSLDHLFSAFYDELHRQARRQLRQGGSVSLGPTTLLHETFLNISQRDAVSFADPRQFMAYAGRAMRGLIIDHFRHRRTQKRGGLLDITSLPSDLPPAGSDAEVLELERLNDALEALAISDARLAECVDLKFFCGLSFGEIAQLRGVSERTVQRDWDKARLLLNQLMREGSPAGGIHSSA